MPRRRIVWLHPLRGGPPVPVTCAAGATDAEVAAALDAAAAALPGRPSVIRNRRELGGGPARPVPADSLARRADFWGYDTIKALRKHTVENRRFPGCLSERLVRCPRCRVAKPGWHYDCHAHDDWWGFKSGDEIYKVLHHCVAGDPLPCLECAGDDGGDGKPRARRAPARRGVPVGDDGGRGGDGGVGGAGPRAARGGVLGGAGH
jgi:hypothetical protein